MRPGLRRVLGVAVLASRWIVRQPVWLIQDLFLVVSMLIILYAWGGALAARSVVIAWLVGGVWGLGVNAVGQEVGWSRVYGTLQLYIASPVKPVEYLAGVLLAQMLTLPLSLAEITLLAALLDAGSLVAPSLAAALLLLPAAVFTGLALAMSIRRPRNISAVTNPVTMMLVMLPPVFYPLKALPGPLRPIALATPTAAAAELARSLAGYMNTYSWQAPLLVLAAWDLAALTAAGRLVKWGHE